MNIIGAIHTELPGVFSGNPSPQVNGALWTIPWEIIWYTIMSVVMITGVVRQAGGDFPAACGLRLYRALAVEHFMPAGAQNGSTLHAAWFVCRGAQLVTAFPLAASLPISCRDRIPDEQDGALCLRAPLR